MKIGAATIGQSPRGDIVPEFSRALGVEAEVLERGALDGLTLEQVRELAPGEGDSILVTRLGDGTEVKIAERHVPGRVQRCVQELEAEGVELVVLFCTAEFPGLAHRRLLVRPDQVVSSLVAALLPRGVLGVVLPYAEQIPMLGGRWRRDGLEVAAESVSPYVSSPEELEAAARRLKEREPDLVVLDCMGFGLEVKRVFRRITGRPVVLPRTLLGRVTGALLE